MEGLEYQTNHNTFTHSLSCLKSVLGLETPIKVSHQRDFIQQMTGEDAASHSQTLGGALGILYRRGGGLEEKREQRHLKNRAHSISRSDLPGVCRGKGTCEGLALVL